MDCHTMFEDAHALAFETSGNIGSVAIGHGAEVLESREFSAPLRHTAEFIPVVDALCRDHRVAPKDIRCVFVSVGPGSFTGLRIGVTAARALALAIDVRVVAVPTLEVIAQNALHVPNPPSQVAVLLDAKRGNVYAGAFVLADNRYVPTSEPAEVEPSAFLTNQPATCAVLGEGVDMHGKSAETSGLTVLPPSLHAARASTVYTLGIRRALAGEFTAPRQLVPHYVRLPEAEEKLGKSAEAKGSQS